MDDERGGRELQIQDLEPSQQLSQLDEVKLVMKEGQAAAEANARRVGALLERLEALQVPWLRLKRLQCFQDDAPVLREAAEHALPWIR
ncbi:hypothetical protein AK812_SmicGene19827 [Symbiodinium microadriaticum]|uniref:Uncharacterized protein n=1 Tax=Symbiodinium microadriaticum TaxID=2951 RepID=A0A1Q9DRH7_SYMMI|nr:hypothetical protein AK812_SmicGene19827 [Symbiodinium microadriaticum]